MKRHLAWLCCVVLAAGARTFVAAQSPVSDQPSESPALVDESSDFWFVELASPPTADGTSLATVRAEKAAFRRAAAAAGLRYTERFAFDTLWNGLSIRIDRAQLGALARLDGVKAVYPVARIELPPTAADSGPELAPRSP